MTINDKINISILSLREAEDHFDFNIDSTLESNYFTMRRKKNGHVITTKLPEYFCNGHFTIQKGRIIGGIMLPMGNNHIILERFAHNPLKSIQNIQKKFQDPMNFEFKIYNDHAFLLGGESDNFGHFILNNLPRLMILKNKSIPSDVKIAISTKTPESAINIIREFCPQHHIIMIDEYEIAEFNMLYAPLMPQCTNISGNLLFCSEFNNFMSRALDSMHGKKDKEKKLNRIYISRSDAIKRKILNETQVIEFLSNYGFSTIIAGTMSLKEQISIARSASVIISGFGNQSNVATFADKETMVFHLNPLEKWSSMNALALFSHERFDFFDLPVAKKPISIVIIAFQLIF